MKLKVKKYRNDVCVTDKRKTLNLQSNLYRKEAFIFSIDYITLIKFTESGFKLTHFHSFLTLTLDIDAAQNGSSFIDNKTHHSENRYLNNTDAYRMPTMTTNLHENTATPTITTFDQHTNPFVFKCEMGFFRKIRVRIDNLEEVII